MNAAVYSIAVFALALAGAAVGAFALDQPVAAWVSLVTLVFTDLLILGMIASTARATQLPPPQQ